MATFDTPGSQTDAAPQPTAIAGSTVTETGPGSEGPKTEAMKPPKPTKSEPKHHHDKSSWLNSLRELAVGPLRLLPAAIEKVPAVKYALAGVAVAGCVAVGIGYFESPAQALVGTIAGFALMVVMVIIALAAALAKGAMRPPSIVLVWFVLVLFMVWASLMTTSVFIGWPLKMSLFDGWSTPDPALSKRVGLRTLSKRPVTAGQIKTVEIQELFENPETFPPGTRCIGVILVEPTPQKGQPDVRSQITGQFGTLRVEAEGTKLVYTAASQPANGTDRFICVIRIPRKGVGEATLEFPVSSSKNTAPTATDIREFCKGGTTKTFSVSRGVKDPDIGDLVLLDILSPTTSGGRATIDDANNMVEYLAPVNVDVVDEFEYTVQDKAGARATAKVFVQVRQSIPSGGDRERSVRAGIGDDIEIIPESFEGQFYVTRNVTPAADGQMPELPGTLTFPTKRQIRFVPQEDFRGRVSIDYAITDEFSRRVVAKGTLHLDVLAP